MGNLKGPVWVYILEGLGI